MSQNVKFYDGNTVQTRKEFVDAAPMVGQQSGRWYGPAGSTANVLLMVNDRLYLQPFVVQRRRIPVAIGVNVAGGGSAGALLRFGIFADADGIPTTLVIDAGTVAATSVSVASASLSTLLEPGLYWLAIAAQGAPATAPTVRNVASFGNPLVGMSNAGNLGIPGYHATAVVGGALATLGAISDTDKVPSILLKL
jgi:hypothetical protein